MSIERIYKTTTQADGTVIHEFELGGFQTYLYMPASDLQINLINYGFTGPTLAVFPDKKLAFQDLEGLARETGLLEIARGNGVGIVLINPRSSNWSGEEAGAYEALTGSLSIAQSNFRDGLAILKSDAIPDVIRYNILGSCVRMYVYGFGSGADYIATHYLKPMAGSAVLGDVGRAELTMVCCTLVGGSVLPKPEKNDIHVVSVGNSEAYNALLKESCLEVTVEDQLDLKRDFIRVVGNYRRWGGKIVHAYNYAAEGIVDRAESVMLPISEDNLVFAKRGSFRRETEHKVGY